MVLESIIRSLLEITATALILMWVRSPQWPRCGFLAVNSVTQESRGLCVTIAAKRGTQLRHLMCPHLVVTETPHGEGCYYPPQTDEAGGSWRGHTACWTPAAGEGALSRHSARSPSGLTAAQIAAPSTWPVTPPTVAQSVPL